MQEGGEVNKQRESGGSDGDLGRVGRAGRSTGMTSFQIEMDFRVQLHCIYHREIFRG